MGNIFKALKKKLSRRKRSADNDGMLEVVEDSPYYPFSIRNDDNGEYTVSLNAEDEYKTDEFEDNELLGNGYDWERLAKEFIRTEMPEAEDEIKFDPEADKFFAYSENEEMLRRFVMALKNACEDDEKLESLIRNIGEE